MKRKFKKNSIRLLINAGANKQHIFKALIAHPMEDGTRRSKASSGFIAADYIENFMVLLDGVIIIEAALGVNVSRNPFISFTFKDQVFDGQHMQVIWIENNQHYITYGCVIELNGEGAFRFNGHSEEQEIVEVINDAPPVCKLNRFKETH